MAEPLGTSAFYAARPNIKLDGQAEPELGIGMLSLSVRENIAGLASCEMSFGNWGAAASSVGFLYFDRQTLEFGRELAVTVGDGDAQSTIFTGRIMALEGRFPQQSPPEMLVLAEDRLQDLRMTRRTRQFDEVTFADVLSTIASDHGLQQEADVDSPSYAILAQVNQSDLAFLREYARKIDAEIWLEDGVIKATARSRRDSGQLELTFGRRLKEMSVTADLATQRTEFVASGWQVQSKEAVKHASKDDAISSEVGSGTSGVSILKEKIGERVDTRVHHVPFTVEQGRTLAEAGFREMARRFVRGRGLADGDGRLRVGTHVTLNGLGPLFEGEYYVTEVNHLFDLQDGFRTQFCVERPSLGSPA